MKDFECRLVLTLGQVSTFVCVIFSILIIDLNEYILSAFASEIKLEE